MANLKSHLKEIFTLDLKSLSLLRILISLILIWNIIERLVAVEVFFSDAGAIPLSIINSLTAWPWTFSFYHLSGNTLAQTGWLLLELTSALCLLIGLKARFAVVLSWLFLCSAQTRNPLILFSGDEALRMTLFWLMFLPIDLYFSINKKVRLSINKDKSLNYYSLASAALISQILIIYFFSGLHKINSYWIQGEALHYIYSGSHMVKPLGHFLLSTTPDWLLRLGGTTILCLEIFLPLAYLFFPVRSRLHLLFPIFFIFFHLFLDLTLRLEFFPYISIACLIVFFRSDMFFQHKILQETLKPKRTTLSNSLIAIFLLLAIYANFRSLKTHARDKSPIGIITEALQLQQDWSMFSIPFTSDAIISAESITQEGHKIDLFSGKDVLTLATTTTSTFDQYEYQRWLRLIAKTTFLRKEPYTADNLANWLCHKQNSTNDSAKRIQQIDFKMKTWPLPNNPNSLSDLKILPLGSYTCP